MLRIDCTYDNENRWIGGDLDSDGDGQIDVQTRFVYDGNQIVLQFDRTVATAAELADPLTVDDLSHRYLWDPAAVDQLMADEQVTDPDVAGDIVWPLGDHQGTIRDLAVYDPATDTTTVVNHRTFDAYGNLQSQTSATVDCLFAYTGRALDQLTGLQNNLHRWYDPFTKRWISEDLLAFEATDGNLVRYCANNPVNCLDPSGLILFAFDGTENDKDADSDLTNVAKLYEAYIGAKVYIYGVGTKWYDFYKAGSATGFGAKGRVTDMLVKLESYLAKQATLPNGGDKNIDIIGFSRGAAEARDFANRIGKILEKYPSVQIRFIGLFDTVPAIFLLPDSQDLTLKIPKYAQGKVFHAVAAHEHRSTFEMIPITTTDGLQVWFPGAHSDIGGGYHETDLSDITLYWMATHATRLGVPIDMPAIPSKVNWDYYGHDSFRYGHQYSSCLVYRDLPFNAIIHPSLALWETYYSNGRSTFDWKNAGFGEKLTRDPILWYLYLKKELENKQLTIDTSDNFLARQRKSGVYVFLRDFDMIYHRRGAAKHGGF